MGKHKKTCNQNPENSKKMKSANEEQDVSMDPPEGLEDNGLILSGTLLPEEVVINILSYVDQKSILKCLLVCKKWHEIVTSPHMWRLKCERINKKCKKKLPWYAYYVLFCDDFFDKNLLLNNCGEMEFKHWHIKSNGGARFIVENPPVGANPVPDEPEFKNKTMCFATSYQNCSKFQIITFKNKILHRKIFDELRPTILVSEWYAGRFDCGCEYQLSAWLVGDNNDLLLAKNINKRVEQWEGSTWNKVELLINEYPKGVADLHFHHKGCDTQFWAGHYGSKMSGACVKILWDSIAN